VRVNSARCDPEICGMKCSTYKAISLPIVSKEDGYSVNGYPMVVLVVEPIRIRTITLCQLNPMVHKSIPNQPLNVVHVNKDLLVHLDHLEMMEYPVMMVIVERMACKEEMEVFDHRMD